MVFWWRKKDWRLDFVPTPPLPEDRWGETAWEQRVVQIADNAKSKVRLETIIHELMHVALGPTATERKVAAMGTMLADVLWRLGYRRTTRR